MNIVNTNVKLPLVEAEQAINEIRAQTVERDYDLIESTHATVVCHLSEQASYGVMSEIIHTRVEVSNPVYVLYPFKKRPSPFFEYYVQDPNNIIRGDEDIEVLTGSLVSKMMRDIKNNLWPRWRASEPP